MYFNTLLLIFFVYKQSLVNSGLQFFFFKKFFFNYFFEKNIFMSSFLKDILTSNFGKLCIDSYNLISNINTQKSNPLIFKKIFLKKLKKKFIKFDNFP